MAKKNKNVFHSLIKFKICVIFLLVIITSLSSCSFSENSITSSLNYSGLSVDKSVETSSKMTSEVKSDKSTTSISYQNAVVSGTLRLWMQKATTLNPLISTNYQWNQISQMFYEGLFQISSNQTVEPLLVKDYSVSSNGLVYTINLKNNVFFHDNSILDSKDVVETVNYILNHANKSIYITKVSNLLAAVASSPNTVEFTIKTLDPFFLYDLVFPILPSEKINDIAVEFIPGTGKYLIQKYDKEKTVNAVLFLKHRETQDNLIKKINILILEDTRKAMEAFGDDKVDMVQLRNSFYETYNLRNDVKIVRYPSNDFLFFEMNQYTGKYLSNTSKSDYLRVVLSDPKLLDGIVGVYCTSNKIPFLSSSPLVHLNKCNDIIRFNKGVNTFLKETKKIEIIYKTGDMLGDMVILQLEKILNYEKIKFNIVSLDETKFKLALTSGNYDIALREAKLTANPDPSWLYMSDTRKSYPGSETLNNNTTEKYLAVKKNLEALYLAPGTTVKPDMFCALINSAYRYGSFVGIGFRLNGVVLSKRVHGQLESNAFNNYNNIKDVWIWSGQ